MSADQTPTRQPAFVTQRDGSALANSNCRMASICMGLDHHSGGTKKSSGGKMRGYTSDQSGGTDSGDAKEAWDEGYSQSLTIRDGKSFNDALEDLRAGKLVHLDVWHATLGSAVCLSGSGAYGHTIAVIPDSKDGSWLVGDPWCTSGYRRVSESKLRAGAEEWGRRVYGAAADEQDWPTAGPSLRQAILNRIVSRLMSISYPTHIREVLDYPAETSGAQPILFTVTTAKPLTGGDMARFAQAEGYGDTSTRRVNIPAGAQWYYLDGSPGGSFSKAATVTVLGMVDGHTGDWLILLNTGLPYSDSDTRTTVAMLKDAGDTYVVEPPAGGGDLDARDAEWREWLLAGSPGSD